MYFLLRLLAYAALALTVIAFWKPRMAPLGNPGKFTASLFYFLLFIIFFSFSSMLAPMEETIDQDSLPAEAPAKRTAAPLQSWMEISRQLVQVPTTGRSRLLLTLAPDKEQPEISQRELLDLAMITALSAHDESGAPIVAVSLTAGPQGSAAGEFPLAQVVYIPDGKGYDGVSEADTAWETFRAAKRGFTAPEAEYMRIWANMLRLQQSSSGVNQQELDAAVSAKLGVLSGSLRPFENRLENAPPPNGYLRR